jgi:hypothetical protein
MALTRKIGLAGAALLAVIALAFVWRASRFWGYGFDRLVIPQKLGSGDAPQRTPSVRLSADKTYLIDADGNPFFINGDAAWALIAQVSKEDAEVYLENRRQKGFNVILASLLEHKFASHAPADYYGDLPFTTAGGSKAPNEAYFAHVDWVIHRAAEKGITVLLDAMFLGYNCGDSGWCKDVRATSMDSMRAYGRYIGHRYRQFPNIIWLIGGDTDPAVHRVKTKLEAMVEGMREFDSGHLFTAHNAPDESAQAVWGNAPWLGLNNVYTYDRFPGMVEEEYNRAHALPLFLVESTYENEHESTPFILRRQMYSTVLWGARAGHIFGNCPIWTFGSAATFCAGGGDWHSELLRSVGSEDVFRFGRLMNSRSHYLMRPDYLHVVMTAGYESGLNLAATSFATDGSSIVSYIPTRRPVTLALSKISGPMAAAQWFNPRTGSTESIGVYPTNTSPSFTPPDDNDWVLVLDDASRKLPPPGAASGALHPLQ